MRIYFNCIYFNMVSFFFLTYKLESFFRIVISAFFFLSHSREKYEIMTCSLAEIMNTRIIEYHNFFLMSAIECQRSTSKR